MIPKRSLAKTVSRQASAQDNNNNKKNIFLLFIQKIEDRIEPISLRLYIQCINTCASCFVRVWAPQCSQFFVRYCSLMFIHQSVASGREETRWDNVARVPERLRSSHWSIYKTLTSQLKDFCPTGNAQKVTYMSNWLLSGF